jgi:ABC-type Mn2+/Zn2+ transport system permease subunit
MTGKKQFIDWIAITLREAAWAPLAVFGFYLFGVAIGLYDRFPPLDIPTHFMGGVAITYFYRGAIRNLRMFFGEVPQAVRIVFAFACTGTTIILWEFYENAFDFLFGTTMVRGLEDTITDMFVGLMGALVLSLLYRRG